jgi:DnaJ family protein B protein 11
MLLCRFFGGFGFGMGGEEEEATPKGNDVFVELEVSLRDLYLGNHFEVCLRRSSQPLSSVGGCQCAVMMVQNR